VPSRLGQNTGSPLTLLEEPERTREQNAHGKRGHVHLHMFSRALLGTSRVRLRRIRACGGGLLLKTADSRVVEIGNGEEDLGST
jgi:hypothetical protein